MPYRLPILLLIALGIALAVYSISYKQSQWRYDVATIRGTHRQWIDAGKPDGAALTAFMDGRRQGLELSTNVYAFAGTNRTGVFSLHNLRSKPGRLIICEDGVLIYIYGDTTNLVEGYSQKASSSTTGPFR